jgi:hypothetical protein
MSLLSHFQGDRYSNNTGLPRLEHSPLQTAASGRQHHPFRTQGLCPPVPPMSKRSSPHRRNKQRGRFPCANRGKYFWKNSEASAGIRASPPPESRELDSG